MQSQTTQPQSTQSQVIKWTLDDYHRMIEAGILENRSVELLAGEICAVAPEGTPHTFRSISLFKRFTKAFGEQAEVRDAHPIILSDSEPEPDIAVVKGTFEDYEHCQPTAEDVLLIVEVASSSLDKDMNQKRIIYAASGIQDYWILDLKNSRLLVFREPQNDDYQLKTELQQGTISPLAFPDVSFAVAQLLPMPNSASSSIV